MSYDPAKDYINTAKDAAYNALQNPTKPLEERNQDPNPFTKTFKIIQGIKNSAYKALNTRKPYPKHKNLYPLLSSLDLLTAAYAKISKNKGGLTPGPSLDTPDGLSLQTLKDISNELKNKTFKFKPVRRTNIPIRKTQTTTQRVSGNRIQIGIDMERVIKRLCTKRYCNAQGFPTCNPALIAFEDYQIITHFNQVMFGITNYYYRCLTRSSYINQIMYILYYSCIKTLAGKHRSTIRKTLRRMSFKEITTPYTLDPTTKQISVKGRNLNIKRLTASYTVNAQTKNPVRKYVVLYRLNEIHSMASDVARKVDQKMANPIRHEFPHVIAPIKLNFRTSFKLSTMCTICGEQDRSLLQAHHIKHIRKGKTTGFAQVMKNLNRKQIIVCRKCHHAIHTGTYDGLSLKDLISIPLAAPEGRLKVDPTDYRLTEYTSKPKSISTPSYVFLPHKRELYFKLYGKPYEPEYTRRCAKYVKQITK